MAKHAATHARKPEPPAKKPKKKKAKRPFKALVITLATLLSLCGICMAALGVVLWQFDYQYDDAIDKLSDSDLGINPNSTALTKKVTNIALFGVDTRSATDFSGNTDSIMIISVDQIHGKIKLMSVMRDTLVLLPDDRGYSKINAAFGKGGAELALKTLNQSFNLNIRDYAVVNFAGMVDIVDAVGGVEITVEDYEVSVANKLIDELARKTGLERDYIQRGGTQTLSGAQAVAWARIRKVSTGEGVSDDYGRTDRQRKVMEQLFEKALSLGVSQYPSLIKALLPYVKTSLSYSDILGLAGTLVGGASFEQTRVPLKEYVIDGGFYARTGNSTVYYDLEYAGKVIHAFVYDDIPPETFMEQNGIEKNRWAG